MGCGLFFCAIQLAFLEKNGIIKTTNTFKETSCVDICVSPDYADFYRCLRQNIYVDKSMVIERINISMPSRFGKSMTANMLTAYYSSGAYFYKWSSLCGAYNSVVYGYDKILYSFDIRLMR